mgnify:FL=1|tara:strand:+ start:192 stop:812 length:621 start_codon:yes stop_codon:yes gene_type:complete
MIVGIVNFKMGNINSVCNALDFLGCENKIINTQEDFENITHLILPGVGSFKDAMINLNKLNFVGKIKEKVLDEKKKILGICLGMQLLGSSSTENGNTNGLSLIENKVEKFSKEDVKQNNIPHVGFNNINIIDDKSGFFNKLTNKSNFYFVHSYKMKSNNLKNDFALCNYGIDFLAAFKFKNIYGVQFHPEKSQSCGIQILSNFLKN